MLGQLVSNRFVAMFDVLGFKALRKSKGTLGLYQLWIRGVLPGIQHAAAGSWKTEVRDGRELVVPDFNPNSVGYRIISDTVILFSRDDTFQSFVNIVASSCSLLQWGFSGLKTPFRSAIGFGDLVEAEENVLLGSAIEDAYVGEGQQVWAGAMLTPDCERFAQAKGYLAAFPEYYRSGVKLLSDSSKADKVLAAAHRIVPYSIPLQRKSNDGPTSYETRPGYALDWTINVYAGAAAASFDTSASDHSRVICANTIAFEQWARANNRD